MTYSLTTVIYIRTVNTVLDLTLIKASLTDKYLWEKTGTMIGLCDSHW